MNKEQRQKFEFLVGELSPENLHEDGEISNRQAYQKEKKLMKQWRLVEKELGRKVTEDEIWKHSESGTYFFEDETDKHSTYDPNRIIRFDLQDNKWLTMKDVEPPNYWYQKKDYKLGSQDLTTINNGYRMESL